MDKLPDFLNDAFKNILDSPTKLIGTLLNDVIYDKFSSYHQKIEKKRLLDQQDLAEFKKHFELQINTISPENFKLPNRHFLSLAAHNLEPCISSEELRQLFAQLIAHACDKNYDNLIHPSFTDVLRQMSPYDAKIFKFFIEKNPEQILTYVQYKNDDQKPYNRIPYLFDEYHNYDEVIQESLAISSLMRLGLISFHDDSVVFPVKNSQFENSDTYKCFEQERVAQNKYLYSEIVGKICTITPFGTAFTLACFDSTS